jgi:hypothetical protein
MARVAKVKPKRMNNKTQKLKLLNIIVSLSIGVLGTYWATVLFGSSDLGPNDKDIISIYIAIAIVITVAVILCLLFYSTIKLFNGIYKRQAQRIGTVLVIAFGVVGDLFVLRFFIELSMISKLVFLYFHVIILLLAVYSFKKVSD